MVFVLVGFDGGLWTKLGFVCGSGDGGGVFVCGCVGGGGGVCVWWRRRQCVLDVHACV